MLLAPSIVLYTWGGNQSRSHPPLSSSKRTLFFPLFCIAFVLESLWYSSLRASHQRERKWEMERMFPPKKPSTMNSHDRPMCVQGDSGLVLTTDPKPRLRWTVELHERFVDAVTQLGGPDSTLLSPYSLSPFFFSSFFLVPSNLYIYIS